MSTVDDLYKQLQKSCEAIDSVKERLSKQLSDANPSQRQQIQSHILSLSLKEGQLQGAFVREAVKTEEIQRALSDITSITENIDKAAKQIETVTSAITVATTVVNDVVQIIGALGRLL